MGASRSFADFRRHLMEGDHWREGRRLDGEASVFTGLSLHRTGGGSDGQEGAHQFSGPFFQHLEQTLVDDRVERDWRNAKARFSRVEGAIGVVGDDRPEEMAALRFYLVPEGRRPVSVAQQADKMALSHDALRYAALKGARLVFDELGCVW